MTELKGRLHLVAAVLELSAETAQRHLKVAGDGERRAFLAILTQKPN